MLARATDDTGLAKLVKMVISICKQAQRQYPESVKKGRTCKGTIQPETNEEKYQEQTVLEEGRRCVTQRHMTSCWMGTYPVT